MLVLKDDSSKSFGHFVSYASALDHTHTHTHTHTHKDELIPVTAFLDVLQGDLSKSLLFYGIYEDNVEYFDLPLSYFLTWIAVNVLTVLYLATRFVIVKFQNQ